MKLTIYPLTPDRWPALEDLFGPRGACAGCWCMWGRIGAAYRQRPASANKAAFHEIVKRGPLPGLLAFDGDLAVGWCQLTPRDAVPWLDRTWRLARVDDVPVWSISCLYVRIGYRRKGVTAALTPSSSSTGFVTTYQRLGFKTVGRHVPPRPIMRHDLGRSRG